MPVRDVAPFIADALTSLCVNFRPDYQFIAVDDGSSDATPEVLEEYAGQLPNLQIIRHRTAVGLADARNAGLDRAEGRLVTFMDGDDWLAPGYLSQLTDAIDDLGCDFVRVDHVQVEGRKRVTHRVPETRRGVVLNPRDGILPVHARSMVDYPYAWAGIYRRELGDLLRFPSGLHTAEDRPWIWRLHREAHSFGVVTLAGVFYRRLVPTSLTQTGDARQLHFLDAYALVLDQVATEPELQTKALRQFLAVLAHHLALGARMNKSLRRQITVRGRAMLAQWPADQLRAARPSGARATLLRPLLPPGARERQVRAS